MTKQSIAYVRTEEAPRLPPPSDTVGIAGWIRDNIISTMNDFSSPQLAVKSVVMIVLTCLSVIAAYLVISGMLSFLVVNATFSIPEGVTGADACRENGGACWPFIAAKMRLMIYGAYPGDQLWRVNLVYFLLALGIAWVVWNKSPARGLVGALMLTAFPIVAFILLTGGALEGSWSAKGVWAVIGLALFGFGVAADKGVGGEALKAFSGGFKAVGGLFLMVVAVGSIFSIELGLMPVRTDLWGGLLVTFVVALTGIVASLPLGILLALGRRSQLPAVRMLSVIFIEFWRGVPLITVLFMSSVMLPFFLPPGTEFDKLLRALIGVALFSSAYMAEVVRGGLQAISKGQYEGGMSLGLSYWQQMRLIILPQALTLVIPGIVNTFIGLFKDTTLVLIIGLFDLLGAVQNQALKDPEWINPTASTTGYVVVAAMFWVFCFGMSRYSMAMERKLHRGHKKR